jgi:hypothetical protein
MRQLCYNCGISGLAQSYTGNVSGWNMLKWRPLCKNGHCQTLPAHSNHSAKPCAWLPHAIGSRRQEPPGPHGDNKRPMFFHLPDVDMDKHLDIFNIYIYNIYIYGYYWILIWIWILILWCTDIIQLRATAFPRLPCWITRWGLSPFVAKNLRLRGSEAPASSLSSTPGCGSPTRSCGTAWWLPFAQHQRWPTQRRHKASQRPLQ